MSSDTSGRRPNILLVISDDQGAWAMGHAGTPELDTPNLDRLARMGKRFNQLYCVSPVCSPARASIMTGRIPSAHGVHDWLRAGNSVLETDFHQTMIDYLDGFPTIAELLSEAGYRCGLAGKWHLGASGTPHRGFDFWRAFPTGGGSYRNPQMVEDGHLRPHQGYLTDIIADAGIEFLDTQTAHQPWYLNVNFTAPHAPWGLDQHQPEDVAAFWPHCDFPSIPHDPMHPDIYDHAAYPQDAEKRRQVLSGYAAAIRGMDRQIGRLLAKLDEMGASEDTVVIFTGDNGMNMGHHGIWGKGNGTDPINLLETSVKVPGIAVMPGRIAPGSLDGIYSHYDLMPTLLGLAGLSDRVPLDLPGRDLSAVLLADHPEENGFAVVFDEYGPHRMIRQGNWKLVLRQGPPGPQLFNLAADPRERVNLIDASEHQAMRDHLQSLLESWFARYGTADNDGFSLLVRGGGQIDHVSAPRTALSPFRLHDGRAT